MSKLFFRFCGAAIILGGSEKSQGPVSGSDQIGAAAGLKGRLRPRLQTLKYVILAMNMLMVIIKIGFWIFYRSKLN